MPPPILLGIAPSNILEHLKSTETEARPKKGAVRDSPTIEYRPAIDGLRAVAVLAVFAFHLNRRWLPGGFVGVDIFFVVSGYLITSIILRDCERNRFSFARFYQRRIARLLGTFFAVAVATIIGAAFIYSDQDFASTGATLSAAAGSVANLKLMLQGNYFVLSPDAQPFLHCWSLSLEEQFYLIFPIVFFIVYTKANKYRTEILCSMFAASLMCCTQLTHKPEWAFYLLPARAWELLAGSILATLKKKQLCHLKFLTYARSFGLGIVTVAFLVISEGPGFPGYLATIPVIGTACLLLPGVTSDSIADTFLCWGPLVIIGRASYSLYLWHWPIFALVDYKFYMEPVSFRVALKIGLSLMATALCFLLIENPGRRFFNHPSRQRLSFAFLLCSLAILIPLGIAIRRTNYINADMHDINRGGIRFNEAARNGSIVLMGDSNASMYGKMITRVAYRYNFRLNVISVAAGDPLPGLTREQSMLWLKDLAIIKREKPDILVLVCDWYEKLNSDKERLRSALHELTPFAHSVILITRPPVLPKFANREGIREGNRAPFLEDVTQRKARMEINSFLKTLQNDQVIVVDIEALFSKTAGIINFVDKDGRQLYEDAGHLSGFGANRVEGDLVMAMTKFTSLYSLQ